MLFGTFHLMHGLGDDAVARYEKDYPNLTFVVTDLTFSKGGLKGVTDNPFAAWPVPSLVLSKGTWLGALDVSHFFPPPFWFDKDCNVINEFHKQDLQAPMADLVNAFLYLGPPELALKEQMPADIALDADYRTELRRREILLGDPEATTMTQKEQDDRIVKTAENPLLDLLERPDSKMIAVLAQTCREHKEKSAKRK